MVGPHLGGGIYYKRRAEPSNLIKPHEFIRGVNGSICASTAERLHLVANQGVTLIRSQDATAPRFMD